MTEEPTDEGPSVGKAGVAHAIVIRFNLYLRGYWERDNLTGDNYLAWCRHRADVFLRLTLPSLLRQSPKAPFVALVYFDTIRNEHVDRVIAALAEIPHVRPVFFDMRGKLVILDFTAQIARDALRVGRADRPFVATTRVDSDDVLSPDFMLALKRRLNRVPVTEMERKPVAVTMPFGAQWDGTRFNAYHYERNSFLTLVERRSDALQTVHAFRHYNVHFHATLFHAFTEQPAWLQIIHDRNAANTFNEGLPRLEAGQMKAWFGIGEP